MKITIKNPVEDVGLESALLKVMAKRNNFEHYSKNLDFKRLLPTTSILLGDYGLYYSLYEEHGSIDFGLFYTQFSQNWHTDFDENELNYYKEHVFPKIQQTEEKEVETCLLGLMKKQTADKLKDLLEHPFAIRELRTVIENYELQESNILCSADKDVHTIDNIDFNVLDKSGGIPWFLPKLQASLGGIIRGQFGIIIADVNTGKSAFMASQVSHTLQWARQAGIKAPVLYFNSEGTEVDVFGRVLSNLYKGVWTGGFEQLIKYEQEAKKKFIEEYGSKQLIVVQMSPSNSVAWLKAKLEKFKPCLAIVDMIDVLAPVEDPTNLKKLYDHLRNMANEFCPILGTSQSGDTSYYDADGVKRYKKWLTLHDCYASKTGKPGAAETMIVIGTDGPGTLTRYISIPKKKRGEDIHISCKLVEKYSLYEELAW